jgi:hypothetical protein
VVRISGPTGDDMPIDKVIGGWSEGYLYGDSWRVNSGITVIREFEDRYEFEGATGSVYVCYKSGEGIRGYAAVVLSSLQTQAEEHDHLITIIPATEAKTCQ